MESIRHYDDYLKPRPDFRAVMTEEGLAGTQWWEDFLPHSSFVEAVRSLFDAFDKQQRSIWISGAYGTGKSHATLVIQKLMMDDKAHVDRFCEINQGALNKDWCQSLSKWRGEGGLEKRTLAIYDYGTDTAREPEDLIFRIERAIVKACEENNLLIPCRGSLEELLKTVEECETSFFRTCKEDQDLALLYLQGIQDCVTLRKCLQGDNTERVISEIQRVLSRIGFHKRLNVQETLAWVGKILQKNPNWGRVLFLWDEFSDYIAHATEGRLKTFEMLSEAGAQKNGFFFVPVTQLAGESFQSLGTGSAKKVLDRYRQCPIEIPANQVYKLGAKALVISDSEGWKDVCSMLWNGSISRLVEDEMIPNAGAEETLQPEDFRNLLPLHPMCAYLLCALARHVGANQRSFFDYLCAEKAFQQFLHKGGPAVANLQYATLDCLWNYFVEDPDHVLESDRDLQEIHDTYARHERDLSPEEARVCKAALLFLLMDKYAATKLLEPTVENVRRAFIGDGVISDPRSILENLAEKHCLAIRKDNTLERYRMRADVNPDQYANQFVEIALQGDDKAEGKLVKGVQEILGFEATRCEIFVVDGEKQTTIRSDVGRAFDCKNGNKIGIYCLLFRDANAAGLAETRMRQMAETQQGRHIIILAFKKTHFCAENARAWEDYCYDWAQLEAAKGYQDTGARSNIERAIRRWSERLLDASAPILILTPDDCLGPNESIPPCTKGTLRERVLRYIRKWFPDSPESYALEYVVVQKTQSLALWFKAGLNPENASGGQKAFLKRLRDTFGDAFASPEDANNPLRKIRGVWEQHLRCLDDGERCSIRAVWAELSRPPYGLLPNAFAAFVLGLTLRPVLQGRNLTLSNGQTSIPLEEQALAREIEAAIKGNRGPEWFIAQTSANTRVCCEVLSRLFNLPKDGDTSPEHLLASLGYHFSTYFGKVPLWVLSRTLSENAGNTDVRVALELIWQALTKGAKDSTIPDKLGSYFRANSDLEQRLRNLIISDNLANAFDEYLRAHAPKLIALAEEVEDRSRAYRENVLARCAQNAGWLWEEKELSTALTSAEMQYEVLDIIRSLCRTKGWESFDDARAHLLRDLTQETQVPPVVLVREYSFLQGLIEKLQAQAPLNDADTRLLLQNLKANQDSLEKILHSTAPEDVADILRRQIPATKDIDTETLLRATQSVSVGDREEIGAYIRAVTTHLNEPDLAIEREKAVELVKAMPAEQAKAVLCDCIERFQEIAHWLLGGD